MAGPDLSEFLALSKPKRPPCAVCIAAKALDADDAAALQAACEARERITASAIVQWLKQRDHVMSTNAVASHRAGTCNRVV